MLNPIVAMLKNESTGRWHPILLHEAPFPGWAAGGNTVTRMRSRAHHTEGFENRDAAIRGAEEIAEKCGAKCQVDADIGWDGAGSPQMEILCSTGADGVSLFKDNHSTTGDGG